MIVVLVLPVILIILDRIDSRLEALMRKNRGFVIYRYSTVMIIFRYISYLASIALLFYYIFYGMSQGLYFLPLFIFFAILCLVGFIICVWFRGFKVCFLTENFIDRKSLRKSTNIIYKDVRFANKTKRKLVLKDKHGNTLISYNGGFKEIEKFLKERCGYSYEK